MIYRFEDFELDTDRFELRRQGRALPIEPQVFALLELLVANRRRMVPKEEINLQVWGGRIVSESVVSSRVRSARQALDDDGRTQRLIRTVHNRGFRFVGDPVIEVGAAESLTVAPDEPIAPEPEAAKPSIAVLPFEMLGRADASRDAGEDGLADALCHDVIVELSRLRWLFVIARGSSFRFRGPVLDLPEVGRLLGVRYCLTGSLAIHGNTSVTTVELIRAAEQKVVWADRLEAPLADLVTLRRALAARIALAIEVRIPLEEAEAAAARPVTSLDAWASYHRGLWHMFRFNRHDNEVAARLFEQAIDRDRGFARAHAGLSFTHFQNAFVGYAKDSDRERGRARAAAERGLELDPLDPFANLTMGRVDLLDGDLDGCAAWLDRSVNLNPNYAFAIYMQALTNAVAGRGHESEETVTKAMALSPLDPLNYAMLATRALSHLVRGNPDQASLWAERAATAPNAHVHVRVIAALSAELAGKRDTAERWAAEIHRSSPGFRQLQFFRAFPFRDEATVSQAKTALKRLAL